MKSATETPEATRTHLTERTLNRAAEALHLSRPKSHPIPPKWSWHHRTLLRLRARLLQSHAEHEGQIAAPLETGGIDVVDTIQDQIDRDLLWAELGTEDNELCEIDAALQRIHDGTYGRCEATGQAIPLARLFALPWTRYCRAAAERIEATRGKTQKRTGRIFVPKVDDSDEG